LYRRNNQVKKRRRRI